jgi:hypothetical protein
MVNTREKSISVIFASVLGIIQDSFKYLKSLSHLDVSRTNLIDFDACLLVPLPSLRVLRIEYLQVNCSSCWLAIARTHQIELFGQCYVNVDRQHSVTNLADQQWHSVCDQSSIDCSIDSCEPDGSIRTYRAEHMPTILRSPSIELLVAAIFSLVALFVTIILVVMCIRWRQGKKLFCCQKFRTATIAEVTRRRRQHHKEVIDNNPVVIESVVTHGANMNLPCYSQQNYAYVNDKQTNNKRKLFNPMFADSPSIVNRNEHNVVMTNPHPSHQHATFTDNL